jgi:type I restriction enzyme, S subunit
MNRELLLQHFNRISEALDAIPRLRRFILDLAVRGKLVEQDPNDEPAAELLKRIMAEKARLLKEGIAKKEKSLSPITDEERPFSVPKSWTWVRLQDITSYIQRGKSPVYAVEDGLPVISQKCVQWRGLNLSAARLITKESIKKYEEVRFLLKNDLLWNSTGTGTIGRIVRIETTQDKLVCDSHVTVVRCTLACAEYVRSWLCSDHVYQTIEDRAAGSTNQVELTTQMATSQIVPLPPLAEQHRIVAKVDELMVLCDQLQAERNKRESRRDRLVASSLNRISTTTAEEAKDATRFHLNHLPRLTTRTEHIKQLRQTILNLAVRGRLVSQDPHDEPATELLKRIVAENKKLLLKKGIRPQKPAPPSENFETESEIPAKWIHVYLQDLAYQITDGTHLTPKYTEQGKPFLSAQNVKPFRFMPQKHRFVSEIDFDNYRANRRPERGDILLTRVGAGIGEAAVLDSDFEFAFYVSLCLIKIPNQLFSAEYLVIWLNCPEGRDSSAIRTYGKGASQGNLNLGLIRTFKIPLPPLSEQHRIVAKVGELMALCDQLEANLNTTEADNCRLLEAVLRDALNPVIKEAV